MKYVCPLIVVKNMSISRDFYENILGQKLKHDFGENLVFEGDFSIHLKEHFEALLGHEYDQIKTRAHNFELYFETADLEATIQKLKDNKIQFIHEAIKQPWGQRVARFYDPDCHIIEIGEPMDYVD